MWIVPLLCLFLWAHFGSGETLNDCTAFSSNGLAASQYQYYRFYDFRNIKASKASKRNTNGSRSKVVTGASWTDDWYIRDYPRKSPGGNSIPVNFIPEKVFIANESNSEFNYTSYLSLNTERVDDETQDAGEITFQEFNISHASVRVNGRVHGASGAVAGIFTYLNDTQESDIEMFTRAPEQYIHYSNQPASSGEPYWTEIPGAAVNVTMPHMKKYTDWHVHRLDWTPGCSVFFLDDEQTNTTTLHVPVADPPSGFYVDMWSANSTWSGSMEVGKKATFDILWIELLFNVTDPIQTSGAQKVCVIETKGSSAVKDSKGFHIGGPSWTILFAAVMLVMVLV